jgi:hypothetical protein
MLSLSEAAKCFPTKSGKSASVLSVRRWCKKGVRGVRLQSQFYAGRFWTTREWIEAFKTELTRRQLGVKAIPTPRPGFDARQYLKDRHGIG